MLNDEHIKICKFREKKKEEKMKNRKNIVIEKGLWKLWKNMASRKGVFY